MPIQLEKLFAGGGRPLIDLLSHCVRSINTDALFLYLVGEYKFRPEAAAAVALHDVFCSPHSQGCIHARSMLSPRDLRLQQSIEPLRATLHALDEVPHDAPAIATTEEVKTDGEVESMTETAIAIRPPLPSPYVFDHVYRSVRSSARIRDLEANYDLARTPNENLPGGEMSAAQRMFVDNVWIPHIRPHLASAGFWRITTIG